MYELTLPPIPFDFGPDLHLPLHMQNGGGNSMFMRNMIEASVTANLRGR
jgi:hypothetical protein